MAEEDRQTVLQKLRQSAKAHKLLLGLSMVALSMQVKAAPASENENQTEISQQAIARANALNEIKDAAPMVCRDGFNRFESLLQQDNIPIYQKAVITARFNLDEYQDMTFPKKQAAALSLEDFQSVCAYYNIQNTTAKVIDLCAQGQHQAADNIISGFSEKYADKIIFQGKGNPIGIQDEVFDDIQESVKQNFDKIFPNFSAQTESVYKANRQELGIQSVKQISDAQYFMITQGDGYYYAPNEFNNQITSCVRADYLNIVKQLNNQPQQNVKGTISWQTLLQSQKSR